MKLTILGSSFALPTSERFPVAHVVNVHEQLYLVDYGEGTQLQLSRNSISFNKINRILTKHFCMIQSYALVSKKKLRFDTGKL